MTLKFNRRTLLKTSALGMASAMTAGSSYRAFGDEQPKRGGDLRIAILGGSTADSMEPHISITLLDLFTKGVLYSPLLAISNAGKIENHLAESLEPNDTATAWTLRLVDAEFHDGRKITSKDVIATFRRVMDPASPKAGAPGLKALDVAGMKALDEKTVYLPMTEPFGALREFLAIFHMYSIVPADFDLNKPVGSGPFKVKSFVPGQRAVYERFDGYFKGSPHVDTLTFITSLADDTAAFNALRSNEVDIFTQAPLSLARRVESGDGSLKVLVNKPAQTTPFTMRCDVAPFDNVDVRTALKLLVNREQMIKLAFNNYGEVGSDLFAVLDPDFDASLKRPYDPDQAKSLLKKAGLENLQLDLVTADIATGSLLSAQVLAQQAKAAGVQINLQRKSTDAFWNENYLSSAFSQTFWPYSPYISQISQSSAPGALYNETRWTDEKFLKLYSEARSTLDTQKRHEMLTAMQQLEFSSSGYIIPSYNAIVDLLSDKVRGLVPSGNGNAIGGYAFADVWLA